MNDAHLTIANCGLMTLVQDSGRTHFQHLGLAQGGAADGYAFFWANYLLSNPPSTAVLEITLGPFEAQFSDDTVIAICGAEQDCTINNSFAANWSTHRIKAGDRIKFRRAREGLRGYLAIKGGWQTPQLLGSRSVVLREKFSGFFGRPIQKKETLPYKSETTISKWINKSVPSNYIPSFQNPLPLRVIPGFQYRAFSEEARRQMTSNSYSVRPDSNRMGYRLQGKAVAWEQGNIISEGIAYGSVQIPPDGQPIVLLNDRQTIGGYPKIGCVRRQDCYQLAQRRPGQKVIFEFDFE